MKFVDVIMLLTLIRPAILRNSEQQIYLVSTKQYFIVIQMFYLSGEHLLLFLSSTVVVVSMAREEQCHSDHQSLLLNKTSPCERRDQLVDLRQGWGPLYHQNHRALCWEIWPEYFLPKVQCHSLLVKIVWVKCHFLRGNYLFMEQYTDSLL